MSDYIRVQNKGRKTSIQGTARPDRFNIDNSRLPRGQQLNVNLGSNPKSTQDAVNFAAPTVKQPTQDAEGNLNLQFPRDQSAKVAKETNNVFTNNKVYKYQKGKEGQQGGWQSAPYRRPYSPSNGDTERLINAKSLPKGKPVPPTPSPEE
jgi:hypothetical protein